jgi:hypothetical protein
MYHRSFCKDDESTMYDQYFCIICMYHTYLEQILPRVSGRHNLPILSRLVIITMKDNKTIDFVFLKNKTRTMIIFVSESQSKKHDHFR